MKVASPYSLLSVTFKKRIREMQLGGKIHLKTIAIENKTKS
jgi:hypothetical protein